MWFEGLGFPYPEVNGLHMSSIQWLNTKLTHLWLWGKAPWYSRLIPNSIGPFPKYALYLILDANFGWHQKMHGLVSRCLGRTWIKTQLYPSKTGDGCICNSSPFNGASSVWGRGLHPNMAIMVMSQKFLATSVFFLIIVLRLDPQSHQCKPAHN